MNTTAGCQRDRQAPLGLSTQRHSHPGIRNAYTLYDASNGWGPGHGSYRYYEGNPIKYTFIVPSAWAYRSWT